MYNYIGNCTHLPPEAITEMVDNAHEITRQTFCVRCDWQEVARNLGYAIGNEIGLHLKDDYAVSFYRSKYQNKKCYFMQWSSIEYVFTLY